MSNIKIKTKQDSLKRVMAECKKLEGYKFKVGIFEDTPESRWLAQVHEYGLVIKPKKARYLTVPCNPKTKGKRASEFHDLFFFQTKDGQKWLCRNKGKDKLEFMYALMSSVTIPERAFIRGGFNQNESWFRRDAGEKLAKALVEGVDVDAVLNALGEDLADRIKEYAVDLNNPPNSPLTKAAKRSANPLVDTGDMIGDITYKVE